MDNKLTNGDIMMKTFPKAKIVYREDINTVLFITDCSKPKSAKWYNSFSIEWWNEPYNS